MKREENENIKEKQCGNRKEKVNRKAVNEKKKKKREMVWSDRGKKEMKKKWRNTFAIKDRKNLDDCLLFKFRPKEKN